MSTINPNQTAGTATIKRPGPPQPNRESNATPKDVADNLRQQADADLQRANALKAEADKLRNEGIAKVGQGAANLAEGGLKVNEGHKDIETGKTMTQEGQQQVQAGIDQENAGLTQEKAAIDSYQSQLGQAVELNGNSMLITGLTALTILEESDLQEQAASQNQTFADQLAVARQQTEAQQNEVNNIANAMVSEAAGQAQVSSGKKQFEDGIAQTEQGSEQLIAGVQDLTDACGKKKLATNATNEANIQQGLGETHTALQNSKEEQAQEKVLLAVDEFGNFVDKSGKADKQAQLGQNALSVSDLLAQIAAVDQEAGAALEQIAGFVAEGNKTINDADLKQQQSVNKKQQGETHLANATALNQEASDSFERALGYLGDADELSAEADQYEQKATANYAKAESKRGEATQLNDEAKALDASGQQKIGQGVDNRLQGAQKMNAGKSSMDSGIAAENAAHDQQQAATANIAATSQEQFVNLLERAQSVVGLADTLDKIETNQADQAELNAAQAEALAAKQQNLDGRIDSLKQIAEGEAKQLQGYATQEAGINKIQAGDQKEREGHDKIKAGQVQIGQGRGQVAQGMKTLDKSDANAQAGEVYANKATKYNEIANQVSPPPPPPQNPPAQQPPSNPPAQG